MEESLSYTKDDRIKIENFHKELNDLLNKHNDNGMKIIHGLNGVIGINNLNCFLYDNHSNKEKNYLKLQLIDNFVMKILEKDDFEMIIKI